MSETDRSPGTPDSAAVLQSMTVLATLSTAAEVRDAVDERKMGHDPSAQAPHDIAEARLRDAGETLMGLLMQLVLGQASIDPSEDPDLANVVRHFDLLMKLKRVERLTQTMHQHLLSLYPCVSEALVEEARVVNEDVAALLETTPTTDDPPALSNVVNRGISFVVWARHET